MAPNLDIKLLLVPARQHTLCERAAFDDARALFLETRKLYSICPAAKDVPDEYRLRLFMRDETRVPRVIEICYIRVMIATILSPFRRSYRVRRKHLPNVYFSPRGLQTLARRPKHLPLTLTFGSLQVAA